MLSEWLSSASLKSSWWNTSISARDSALIVPRGPPQLDRCPVALLLLVLPLASDFGLEPPAAVLARGFGAAPLTAGNLAVPFLGVGFPVVCGRLFVLTTGGPAPTSASSSSNLPAPSGGGKAVLPVEFCDLGPEDAAGVGDGPLSASLLSCPWLFCLGDLSAVVKFL